jgi:hypothetical protein
MNRILLQPLARRNQGQRISLYADDVALFIRSVENEMNLTMNILACFGEASGLQTDMQKSCVIPIRCEQNFFRKKKDVNKISYKWSPPPCHVPQWIFLVLI